MEINGQLHATFFFTLDEMFAGTHSILGCVGPTESQYTVERRLFLWLQSLAYGRSYYYVVEVNWDLEDI